MNNHENPSNSAKETAQADNKNLMAIAQYLKDGQFGHKKSIPPLEQWHPKHCGAMDLKVKANGEWWHEGQLIKRQALINLFSTVLWKEADKFYLKTPVEQIEIEVEDEPLFVNQVDEIQIEGQRYIQFTTTTDDIVVVDATHRIFMREFAGELRPYVQVRFGLNALIQRATFMHLVQMGELTENEQGQAQLSLKSGNLHLQLDS
ncbi:DUF1285 domain-containing protein [Acinetobacter cumulans]|uniref:DUF1285 domain-containing protein n=1 Tax=Acinetobacter cumulans TaxID=2136182 RepID=A0A3A8GJ53_9GAMM|nr:MULTISPECIES: DUF1285 domain-containing protein [Acinetobacter]NWK76039.1 DUF1285 domain-containing protein [Acinetobacter sp. SwsAc6]QCO21058.1 DUF1285 domain-containing protein [Acinetobacter cumulans]RFS33973.1 DUF1285 domain-containing protein [Acinetobacter sp. SWAC5]RKG45705.1 DUF1285 domain-containing protein [Acinetobacter cumulans]RKG53871.1 DUF1285 domain-containing protein [Acinetobacter cumulans]